MTQYVNHAPPFNNPETIVHPAIASSSMARNRSRNQAKRGSGDRPTGFVDVDINDEDQQQQQQQQQQTQQRRNVVSSSPPAKTNFSADTSPIMQPKPTRGYPYHREDDEDEDNKGRDAERPGSAAAAPAQTSGWTGFLFGASGGSKAAEPASGATSSPIKTKRSVSPPPGFNPGRAFPTSSASTSSKAPPAFTATTAQASKDTDTAVPVASVAPKPGWSLWGSTSKAEELKTSPKLSPKFGAPVSPPPPAAATQPTSGFKPSNQRIYGAPGYTYPTAPPPSRSFATASTSKRPSDIESFGGKSGPAVAQAYPSKDPLGGDATAGTAKEGAGKKSLWLFFILMFALLAITGGVVLIVVLTANQTPVRPKMVVVTNTAPANPSVQ